MFSAPETRKSMDICTKGHTKRRACKKNRNWHRRPNHRKSVVQPPAMQSRDKNGPKEIAKKWEQTGAWPPSKEPPQEARATNDDGGTLRFPCSRCEDNSAYAPKDLTSHFVEKHRGSMPVFSCHMCTFCTHEFSYLQVHLLSHKDTFSSCSMCNDNVQRTWPEFSAHLAMRHCTDGKYSCETCKKFSTCDFRVFLEHIYEHNLNVEEVDGRQPPSAQTPCCKFCGFEAPEKWLINKHVRAAHVCQNGNQRDDGRQARSMATKPNDPIPRVKTRLTRSTDRTACWLTPDCLSLPGKEFLDKYCHLSDPQTTLEETQQFLMQSVVGETDDQKWTKALKSALQKNSGNGIAADTADVAILTVKNNITMPQNGAAYPKRLKTSSGNKEAVCSEGADGDPLVGDQNRFDLNLKNQAPCLPCNGFSPSGTGTQEHRENNKLETETEIQENIQKLEEPRDSAGFCKLSDLNLTNESEERTSAGGVPTNGKMQKRRRRRKARFKKVQRRPQGEALTMVIKKNVVKGKRWVSQSSSSPKEEVRDQLETPNPPPVEDVQPVRCVDQSCIQGSPDDPPSLLKQTAIFEFVMQRKPEDTTTENESDLLGCFPSTHREIQDVAANPQDLSGESGSAEGTGETDPAATSETDQGMAGEEPQKSQRRADGEATEEKTSPAAVTPHGKMKNNSFCTVGMGWVTVLKSKFLYNCWDRFLLEQSAGTAGNISLSTDSQSELVVEPSNS